MQHLKNRQDWLGEGLFLLGMWGSRPLAFKASVWRGAMARPGLERQSMQVVYTRTSAWKASLALPYKLLFSASTQPSVRFTNALIIKKLLNANWWKEHIDLHSICAQFQGSQPPQKRMLSYTLWNDRPYNNKKVNKLLKKHKILPRAIFTLHEKMGTLLKQGRAFMM